MSEIAVTRDGIAPSMLIEDMRRSVDHDSGPKGRFLSRDECFEISKTLIAKANGGGVVNVGLESVWSGSVRWARNQIASNSDVRRNTVTITRIKNFAEGESSTNEISDWHLESTLRRAERLIQLRQETAGSELIAPYIEPYHEPTLWFDRTYALSAEARAEVVRHLVQPAEAAGMLAAGYIQVSAHGRAAMQEGIAPLYYPFTRAQYSVTVRDPDGTGSGWAGVDGNDWEKIDVNRLSAIALDKCLRSRNPVAVEPGRYTAILEPQAVNDLFELIMLYSMDRTRNEDRRGGPPFWLRANQSKIGLQVIDPRLSISVDPMDPDIGFPPFEPDGRVYNPVTWIEKGVLKQLAHDRRYAIQKLGRNDSRQNSLAYKMNGDGTTSVESMIETTKRGLLVTRFANIEVLDAQSMLLSGTTRDGLWLIENGKISKAVKNFRITESPVIMLNNVLEIGVSQRVFREAGPACVPALKVQDFSFTSMSDAV